MHIQWCGRFAALHRIAAATAGFSSPPGRTVPAHRGEGEDIELFAYRSQRVALTVSVVIHILILLLYRPLARIQLFPDRSEAAAAAGAEPLVFELVETPDDAIRQRPESGNLLSDKNALARDESPDDAVERDDPYSEGRTRHRIFAARPEQAGTDGETSPEARADRSRDGPRGRVRDDDPDGTENTFESPRQEVSPAETEDYLRLEAARNPLSMRLRFSDDVDYDQRAHGAKRFGGVSLSTYAWEYADYIQEMKRKLRANTHPPGAFTLLGIISGEAVLRFRVLPDGTAIDITEVTHRGDRSLMETSLDAVRFSSPFRSLPPDFPDEYLELTWTFIYTVYR